METNRTKYQNLWSTLLISLQFRNQKGSFKKQKTKKQLSEIIRVTLKGNKNTFYIMKNITFIADRHPSDQEAVHLFAKSRCPEKMIP